MAKEVNLQISGWTPVGTNASVPRYSVNLTTQWIDNAGAPRTDIRGSSQVGNYRELGAVEYDTYTATPGTGTGIPMVSGGN